MNDILKRINDLRTRKGWSQYELAKITGISPNAVYSWSRSGAIPTLQNIERICEVANITVEQFFYDGAVVSGEEKDFLDDWMILSELEKQAIFEMIEVFKTIKA